ncbi:MAG: carbohydrate kinase [Eubacteriaceae bacterium]|nr:carbohydrate kinase [Eubacteriaceae bacterium]
MNGPLILTFDVGTQNTRAMLVNKSGDILDMEKITYEIPYYSKQIGWAEQSADFYWELMCKCSLALKERNEQAFEEIIGVTLTTIRDSVVCVDKKGRPLRDAILWLDKRETVFEDDFSFSQKALFKAAGMLQTAELIRKTSVCNWIIVNEPEIWKKTHTFTMISGYLSGKLTGVLMDCSANMIGHIPFDSKRRKWMRSSDIRRKVFDIPNSKLCEFVEPGEILGNITKEACRETGIPEELPLYASGSDKGCETLGLSVTDLSKAALSFGTTATVQLTSKDYMEAIPFIPAYPAVMRDHYNPEVEIYRGYWLLNWFMNEFAGEKVQQAEKLGVSPEELMNKQLKNIPPGCDGLIFQPYFTPGVSMPEARGAMIGFSDNHTKAHIYRAIIEGINFALMEGLRGMEKQAKIRVRELYAAGGGSKSDEILQITADMFGIPVKRIQTYEVAGLGSAMVGFVGAGQFEDYESAIASMVHVKDTFEPDMSVNEFYNNIYNNVYEKVFTRLMPLYKRHKDITEENKKVIQGKE